MRGRILAVLAAAALYGALLAHFADPYAAGSDTSGYLNHARLIASGSLHAPRRELAGLPASEAPPDAYTPLGLKPAPDGNGLVPTYPAGLPLLLAAAARWLGWERAAAALAVAHALLGIGLAYALARRFGLPRSWSGVAAAILAVSPLYLLYALQVMSDVPSLVWVGAAVLAAWNAGESGGRRGASLGWSLSSGACLSLAFLIRPNSAIAIVPVAIALGASPRRWAMLVLGFLPGAAFFLLHSRSAYGSAFTTGYGLIGYLFSASFVPASLSNYARWLPVVFTPAVLLIAGLPWAARREPRAGAVIGSWVLTYLAFYAPYRTTHETWWYLRYLLPAAPPLIAGGLLVARQWIPARREAAAAAAALGLVLANGAWWDRHFGVLNTARNDTSYRDAAQWLNAHAPARSVVETWQASGALYYYTSFVVVRWDLCDRATMIRFAAAARAEGRPLYAVVFQHEVEEAFRDHIPGRWVAAATMREITIWRWEGGSP